MGVALCALILWGCQREDEVAVYDAPKEPVKLSAAAPSVAAAQADADAVPHWTVPAGWKPIPGGGQLRFATFIVSEGNPSVALTVIPLSKASGTLAQNVNRWEAQIGKEPTPEDQIGKVVQHLDVNGVPVDMVDVSSPPKAGGKPELRILGAIVPYGEQVWFFKIAGPYDQVTSQKENFTAFMKSVRFGPPTPSTQPAGPGAATGELPAGHPPLPGQQQQMPAGHPPIPGQQQQQMPAGHPPIPGGQGAMQTEPGSASSGRITGYVTPPGWELQEQAQAPRILVFLMGKDDAKAELSVTKFGKTNFGDMPANVQRWRSQVGLEPSKDPAKEAKGDEVNIGGVDGQLFDFIGPRPKEGKRIRMIIAMRPVGDDMWFFKLVGPDETVGRNKDALKRFLRSLRFSSPGE